MLRYKDVDPSGLNTWKGNFSLKPRVQELRRGSEVMRNQGDGQKLKETGNNQVLFPLRLPTRES